MIIGDFNFDRDGNMIFKKKTDMLSRNNLKDFFRVMSFNISDIEKIYDEYDEKCGFSKNMNINIFYKFKKKYNLEIFTLPCDFYLKTSSHPILNIRIKEIENEIANGIELNYLYENGYKSFISVLHGIICNGLIMALEENKGKIAKNQIHKIINKKKNYDMIIKKISEEISELNEINNSIENELKKFDEFRNSI